jgi:hypothetical protein
MKSLIIAIAMATLVNTSVAAPATREPPIDLKTALARAERYVRDHKIDLSGLYLFSVDESRTPKNPKQDCWVVIWAPKNPNIDDGEVRVYVYFDGRVEHGGSA